MNLPNPPETEMSEKVDGLSSQDLGSSRGQMSAGLDAAGGSGALKPSAVLERAATLVEPEGAWTQGAFGRTAAGEVVRGGDAACVCRCAMGAVDAALGGPWWAGPEYTNLLRRVLNAGRDENDTLSIGEWNDATGRTQAEVVAALRKAAELARSEGQ